MGTLFGTLDMEAVAMASFLPSCFLFEQGRALGISRREGRECRSPAAHPGGPESPPRPTPGAEDSWQL